MKKYWWLVLLLLAMIFFFIRWWWRSPSSSLKKEVSKLGPEVKFTTINIYDLDADRIKLNVKIILSNPLPVVINTRKFDYAVFIDSVKVIESSYTKPIKINSSDHATIELPMEILAEPIKNVLEKLDRQKKDSATYIFKSTLNVDIPVVGERDFHIDISRVLPAVRIPKGKLEKIQVDKLGFDETSLDLVLNIENPNVFPLKLDSGYYKVSIEKDLDMDGYMEKHLNIPAKQTSPIKMHLVLKTVKVGKLAWKSLFEKKDTHFKVLFTGKLNAENKIIENSKFTMTITGTLDELKN